MKLTNIIILLIGFQLIACVHSKIEGLSAPCTSVPTGQTYNKKGEYLLAGGDRLSLIVVQRPDLNLELGVDATGMIQHPFFATRASGRTLKDLSDDISKKLRPYVSMPTILLSIKNPASFKVYVSGEINKPGEYGIDGHVWLGDIVAMGGGMTRFASKNILLIRLQANGPQRFVIRYDDLIRGAGELDKLFLERGDHLHFL